MYIHTYIYTYTHTFTSLQCFHGPTTLPIDSRSLPPLADWKVELLCAVA